MKISLGYVSISNTLDITTSHTISLTNYKLLSEEYKKIKLNKIINNNLDSLLEILKYNYKNNIHFYRITSKLIPLADIEKHNYYNKYLNKYKKIGSYIKETKQRVDFHPDQFCVLNSTNKKVIENSYNILNYHNKLCNYMNLNSKLILHIGSSSNGKEQSTKRFIRNYKKLPLEIKKRIILENDDKIYNIVDTLDLCNKLKVPMVLDYHHYLCNNNKEKIDSYIVKIFDTWKNTNLKPKIHFSSPKSKLKKDFRAHNDYINVQDFIDFINKIKFTNTDIDIMLEAKMKDEALFKLVRQLKYYTNYTFIDDTTFVI